MANNQRRRSFTFAALRLPEAVRVVIDSKSKARSLAD
jgi:hypothetical protein